MRRRNDVTVEVNILSLCCLQLERNSLELYGGLCRRKYNEEVQLFKKSSSDVLVLFEH